MKQARTRPLLDRPDDVGIDIALIATSFAIGVAALIYVLAI